MCLEILLNTLEKRLGHGDCQRPFFLVFLYGRILERLLTLFPLAQRLIQKALDKCLLGER